MVNRYGATYQKRIVVSIRKSTIRLILVLYFILLFFFCCISGRLGNWKQDKYSETAYMEELEGEDRTLCVTERLGYENLERRIF